MPYFVDNDNKVTFDRDPKTGVDISHILDKKTGQIIKRDCGKEFRSRNALFNHLRDLNHMISSDSEDDRPEGSVGERYPSTDDGSRAPLYQQDSTEARAKLKPLDSMSHRGSARGHPGPILKRVDVKPKDLEWTDIGSGMVARTILDAKKFITTSRNGPCVDDIQSRRIWSLTAGK